MISVIVPVYNAENYLDRCLDSIEGQTYKEIEIVIVDDGSTDGTEAICRRHQERDSRIHIYQQENYGVSAARNLGIDKAKGDYIAFCDSDDILDKSYLEVLWSNMKTYHSDISACNFYRFDKEEQYLNDEEQGECIYRDKDAAKAVILDQRVTTYLWNKLFQKELFQNLFFPREMIVCEDVYALLEMTVGRPITLSYTGRPLYFYRINETGLSYSYSQSAYDKYCNAYSYILNQDYPDDVISAVRSKMYDMENSIMRRCMLENKKKLEIKKMSYGRAGSIWAKLKNTPHFIPKMMVLARHVWFRIKLAVYH